MYEVEREKLRVLVVDDDPAAVTLLSAFLTREGHEVLTAVNGKDALKTILDKGPSMVVTDWMMPEMDGLELCRAIRSHEGIPFTYVIIVTVRSDDESMVEAFDAGADDFIIKPMKRCSLMARIRAGQRIIRLKEDVDRRNREVHRFNAEMAIAHSRLADANETLNRMATTDELTGLTNRREALIRLEELWTAKKAKDRMLACVALDIDHFKSFNDVYGHAVGDLVLKDTARMLRTMTPEGALVCRIGGEEFLIVCPRCSEPAAVELAEQLRRSIEESVIRTDELELRVTVSLGVAERTVSMTRVDDLLRVADEALYIAKDSGRNKVCSAGGIAAHAAPEGTVQKPTTPSSGYAAEQGAHVLIVDDSGADRTLYRAFLERAGYEVTEAVNGREALSLIGVVRPDVVLMDTNMPEMSGPECTRLLKSNPDTREIPVVMTTARTDATDVETCIEAGADEYLNKPVDARELLVRIRSMLRLSRSDLALTSSYEVRGEQSRALSLLLDYSRDLAIAPSMNAILERTLQVTSELTCCARVAILLPDPKRELMTIARAVGINLKNDDPICVPVGAEITGKVFSEGSTLVLNDAGDMTGHHPEADASLFDGFPLVSKAMRVSESTVGVLHVAGYRGGTRFAPHQLGYLDLISSAAAAAIDERLTRRARDDAQESIVIALAKLAEYRDSDTSQHVERVTQFCLALARQLQESDRYKSLITEAFIQDLVRAAPLHDIGKVGIPDQILNKPGPLTDQQRGVMRNHTRIGANTLRTVLSRTPNARFLSMAEEIAGGHHEWYNGRGYPQGLTGDEIPLAARIAAVADVYDALTTRRVYKEPIPHDIAIGIIFELSGLQFDPDIVEALRQAELRFEQLAFDLADDPEAAQKRALAGFIEDLTPLDPLPAS